MLSRLLLASWMLTLARGFCPSGCECDDTGLSVRCLGVGITMVPILLNPALKKINLAYNLVSTISQAFEFYEWLEEIDLSHNQIKFLGERNFEQQFVLKKLVLSHNNMTNVNLNSFRGLASLQLLDLTHNHLIDLPVGVLSDSRKLKVLLLSHNRLQSLPPKAFKGVKSLIVLDLCDNYFRRVPGASLQFVGDSLETLQMCKNRIMGIQPDDFPTPNLKYVNLESNHISFINAEGFQHLQILQTLNLNNNYLNDIPTRSFFSLFNMHKIYLSSNNISVIKDSAFQGLFKLNEVDISWCPNLKQLGASVFDQCQQLKSIKLSHNPQLEFVPATLFAGLKQLEKLDLRNNGLQTVIQEWIPWSGLRLLDLRGNPLVCNCSLKWLANMSSFSNGSLVVPEVECAAPDKLRGVAIASLSKSNFSCMNQLQLVIVIASSIAAAFLIALSIILCSVKERRKLPQWKSLKL